MKLALSSVRNKGLDYKDSSSSSASTAVSVDALGAHIHGLGGTGQGQSCLWRCALGGAGCWWRQSRALAAAADVWRQQKGSAACPGCRRSCTWACHHAPGPRWAWGQEQLGLGPLPRAGWGARALPSLSVLPLPFALPSYGRNSLTSPPQGGKCSFAWSVENPCPFLRSNP